MGANYQISNTSGFNIRMLPLNGALDVDLSDGKIFTTMEWLMVFVKVPL